MGEAIMRAGAMEDKSGCACGFDQDGSLKIYSVTENACELLKEKEYVCDTSGKPSAIRESLREAAEWLSGCRVLVSGALKGMSFTVMDGRFPVRWEIEGDVSDFISHMPISEMSGMEERVFPEQELFEDRGNGFFFIDLEKALNSNQGITSKKVLIPFLENGDFKALEIKAGHVPRWLCAELDRMGFKHRAEQACDHVAIFVEKPLEER
jgi:Fe-only nitrogenase accessory protein AnfO